MGTRWLLKLLFVIGCVAILVYVYHRVRTDAADAGEARRLEWLRTNSLKIRTIDPADDDFTDLRPLARLIGDRRFVLMGETTHFDGATFDARARLVRFLHQQLGFDVVCIEASYSGLLDLYDSMRSTDQYLQFQKENPNCQPLQDQRPLMDYVQSTIRDSGQPIALIGDSVNYFTDKSLVDKVLLPFVLADSIPFTPKQRARFEAFLKPQIHDSRRKVNLTSEDIDEFNGLVNILLRHMETNRQLLVEKLSLLEIGRIEALIASLPAFVLSMTMDEPHDLRIHASQLNVRDKAMADLVIFAAERLYPDRRFVVTAAHAHLLRSGPGFEPMGNVASMGQHLHNHFGDEIYTIVFDAHSGFFGLSPGYSVPVPPASDKTLAYLFHKLGDDYRFLDLRGIESDCWLRTTDTRLRIRGFLPNGDPARWPEIVDAVFFIDQMYGVTL